MTENTEEGVREISKALEVETIVELFDRVKELSAKFVQFDKKYYQNIEIKEEFLVRRPNILYSYK